MKIYHCLFLTLWLSSTGTIVVPARAEEAAATNQSYAARGIVRQISADRTKATIKHEAIKGYMPAMTMEFNLQNSNELSGISVGDIVTFQLTATDETHWIDHLRKVGSKTNQTDRTTKAEPHALGKELKPGDLLPDSDLLSESSNKVKFSDFRGKAVALTFFFTRCPLPDFCPRMANNFAEARKLLLSASNTPTNWQFISISFDAEFDNPSILAGYANFYRKDNPDRWLFTSAASNSLAVLAPQLDLMLHRDEGGSISHNLRTVVLSPDGRIFKQFDGNNWTPKQLADSLVEAAAKRDQKIMGQ